MYNEYFGFKEAPFSIAPDPRYLYMTAQHRDALAHLVYGLNSEGGCILLTGEVGTGKTTICRCLLEQIPDQANVALVLNPKLSEIELLETICDELKIDYPEADNSIKTYTDRIYSFLIKTNRDNEKTVLIIDEAQNLSSKVLEQLRLLTNLETNQRKLLQIIILGQPELLDILARPEMRQLAQRITARFHLEPLSRDEVKAYISHRLAVAGQNIQLFPEKSLKLLYKLSGGIPRLINVICDRSLLGAYVENQYSVQPSIIKKAAHEVFGELKNVQKKHRFRKWLPPASVAVAVSVLSIAIFYFSRTTQTNPATAIGQHDSASESVQALSSITAAQQDTVNTGTETPDNAVTTILANQNDIDVNSTANSMRQDSNSLPLSIETENPENSSKDTSLPLAASEQFDDIEYILQNPGNNKISAYQQLFSIWQQPYNPAKGLTACKQAANRSLSCLFKQGNLNSLKIHDRPAVLKLITRQGENRYVTITALNNNSATILADNTEYTIALNELNQYWYGQFILFWRKPENYSAAITPGENGNIVNWLYAQFSDTALTTEDRVYDKELTTKVKSFQAKHGLAADGIVGPVTIIHLNTQSGMDVPNLSRQS